MCQAKPTHSIQFENPNLRLSLQYQKNSRDSSLIHWFIMSVMELRKNFENNNDNLKFERRYNNQQNQSATQG